MATNQEKREETRKRSKTYKLSQVVLEKRKISIRNTAFTCIVLGSRSLAPPTWWHHTSGKRWWALIGQRPTCGWISGSDRNIWASVKSAGVLSLDSAVSVLTSSGYISNFKVCLKMKMWYLIFCPSTFLWNVWKRFSWFHNGAEAAEGQNI